MTHHQLPTWEELQGLSQTRYEATREEIVQLMQLQDRNREEAELRADERLMEADFDRLTGLLNRRGLIRRTEGRAWGWWVVADLDRFKTWQDAQEYGHQAGDDLLQDFARFLLSIIREGDLRPRDAMVARTGGDEFTIWMETKLGARRVRDAIRDWQLDIVTASAGIGKDQPAADAAMYLDKGDKAR